MAALSQGAPWAGAAAIAVFLLASVSQGIADTPEQVVRIENMAFAPATLTVQRGTQVAWHNHDLVPHTVTVAGTFDSGSIAPGRRWTSVVKAPGRYDYVCAYHPGMKATLVVQP